MKRLHDHWVRRTPRLTLVLVVLASWSPTWRADAISLDALLAAIDPTSDPGVGYFASTAVPTPEAWVDLLRWSAEAGVSYDYSGATSISSSTRVTVPLDIAMQSRDRWERHRIDAALASLERDNLSREVVYGVLDLACRWGYLRTIEPWLDALAADGSPEATIWLARRGANRQEVSAVSAQLDAHAPAVRPLLTALGPFLCKLPDLPTAPLMDGIDRHPSLERIALESVQDSHRFAFYRATGGPELTLDGSVRYALAAGDLQADIRLSARIPFSVTGGSGSVTAESDPFRTSLRLQINSSAVPEDGILPEEAQSRLANRLARERASLEYRIASASGAEETLQAQESLVWSQLAQLNISSLVDCEALCPSPTPSLASIDRNLPLDAGAVRAYLDALGLSYELSRARLELMRILALEPATLITPWIPKTIELDRAEVRLEDVSWQ